MNFKLCFAIFLVLCIALGNIAASSIRGENVE